MTAPSVSHNDKVQPRSKRFRPPPPSISILDREALVAALDEADVRVKNEHIDAFYQSLHRQHYPSLGDFVETYYRNEAKENLPDDILQAPIKNAVSGKKNRNRKQLPKAFLQFLANPETQKRFTTMTSTVDLVKTSSDQSTTKLAVRLHDGQFVESVLMRYGPKGEKQGRASLCVSSQVGCAMGCTFCATGTMGLTGNLSYTEILEQMIHANRILAKEAAERAQMQEPSGSSDSRLGKKKHKINDLDLVRNVVFMGMGEPLDNYDNVVTACRALIDRKRWNLAHGRVTVSTVGLTPKMRKLTIDLPEVSIALSLHAPSQEKRSEIVPTATHYPIEGMIEALDQHMIASLKKNNGESMQNQPIKESTRRRAMIEYVMLEGDTSSFESAHELGKLCEGRHLVVNLIPYNQTDVKDKLRCPTESHMREFQRIVSSYRVFCTIRRTMGADISSACGQLVVAKKESSSVVPDIEDVVKHQGGKDVATQKTKFRKGSKSRRLQDSAKLPQDKAREYENWILPLSIATTAAASCFVLSTFLYMRRKR